MGTHLAKMLNEERHEITVIDHEQKLLENITDTTDILTIEGDFTTFNTLNKALVRKADLFIAVSPDENANILAGVLAKQLGAKKSIARIDHDEYLSPNNKEIFINMGIDYLFYPESIAAKEIISLLSHTVTTEYADFAGGRLSLVVFKLEPSSSLVGRTLIDVTPNPDSLNYRTIAISRGGRTIIPHRNDLFEEGDTIYVVTTPDKLKEVTDFSGTDSIDVKNIMILGGSRIGIGVARGLENHANVKLVEYNQEKAYHLAELLDKTLIIHEDGRNTDAMLEEGINNMDAFVAVTGRSETNILAAMLAKRLGVKKVIAEVENLNYINLAESMGIDTIINKKMITAGNIFRFTLNTDVQAIKYLTGSDAEIFEFIAKPGSPATKGRIRDIKFPHNALIGGIIRGENTFIGVGNFEIKAYDRVVVIALPEAVSRTGKFFN